MAVKGKMKNKSAAKKKTKRVEGKKVKRPVRNKAKSVVKKPIKKSQAGKVKSPVIKPSLPEVVTHGEDLHFIPEQEEQHTVTTLEAHQAENIFHQREEVAIRQENQKVKAAMSSQKTVKSSYRRGQK